MGVTLVISLIDSFLLRQRHPFIAVSKTGSHIVLSTLFSLLNDQYYQICTVVGHTSAP